MLGVLIEKSKTIHFNEQLFSIYLGAYHDRTCLASAKDILDVYFSYWFEIRRGCGAFPKDIYINAACIISDVILVKSKNGGARNIFALLKHMINSKPYHSCLPQPLSLSSLSRLMF